MDLSSALRTIAATIAGGNPCPQCSRRRPVIMFGSEEEFEAWKGSEEAIGCGGRCGQTSYPQLIILGVEDDDPLPYTPAPESLVARLRPDWVSRAGRNHDI